MKTDFLIVGQGLAGSLLAIELLQGGASVLLVDRGVNESATAVSTGIINPLTGRLFALSWRFDELMAEARNTYSYLEHLLGTDIFEETTVSRAIMHTKGVNDLMMRLELPDLSAHIEGIDNVAPWPELLKPAGHYVHISGARVNTRRVLRELRKYFTGHKLLISDSFCFADVEHLSGSYTWKGVEARELVWCGGAARPDQEIGLWPVVPLKGQILRIKVPGVSVKGVVKHQIFLANEGSDIFWTGATHEPTKCDPQTDYEGLVYLKEKIDEMLVPSYTVVSHEAAMRPVVKDRRPVMGWYNEAKIPFFVLSGLGTKGASLAPWCAKYMAMHLLNGQTLPAEVNLSRFLKQP